MPKSNLGFGFSGCSSGPSSALWHFNIMCSSWSVPCLTAASSQAHFVFQNVSLVRGGAIVTQLVFNHALKIRVKAETEREPVSDNTTAAATPDGASVVEASGSSEAESAAADDGDLSKKKGKQPEASISGDSTSTKVAEEPKKKDKGGSLLGKLNNLVTSDWSTISDGSDLCMISTSLV